MTDHFTPALSFTTRTYALIRLTRPKQWIKNCFVFMPLIFAGKFLDSNACLMALTAFISFSLMASATYIINDIQDIDADRRHPIKSKKRPLAAGEVSKREAIQLLCCFYLGLGVICYTLPVLFFPIAAYAALNLAYTFALKYEPIIDIFCISSGFVLRIIAGAIAIQVGFSSWMLITGFSLALYLASMKRYQELKQHQSKARKSLEQYSLKLIEKFSLTSAISAILFYSLFVMTSKPQLALTIPLILFGLFRYWFLVEMNDLGESPTDVLFKDWQLTSMVLLWVGICAYILWPQGGISA